MMRRRGPGLLAALVTAGLGLAPSAPLHAADASELSLIRLIATPEQYAGRRVRVIGYVQLQFESNAVYLSADDADHSITKNGLWLEVPEEMAAQADRYDGFICIIEGTFNASNHGHMGLWSGALEQLTRLDVWEASE